MRYAETPFGFDWGAAKVVADPDVENIRPIQPDWGWTQYETARKAMVQRLETTMRLVRVARAKK